MLISDPWQPLIERIVRLEDELGKLQRLSELWTISQLEGLLEPNLQTTYAPLEHDPTHDDRFSQLGHSHVGLTPGEHDTQHDDRFVQLTTFATHQAAHALIVSAEYTGNGATAAPGIQIPIGFKPSIVIIVGGTSSATVEQYTLYGESLTQAATYQDNSGNITFTNDTHIHATDGFVIGDGPGTGANTSGKVYRFMAFRGN